MKKSFIIVTIILSLTILGCVLPSATSQKERKTDTENQSVEKEKLKEKIAELEKEKLEEKIDELEKKVEEKEGGKNVTIIRETAPKSGTTTKKPPKGSYRVNTPGDGFLALRTAPSTARGSRILKIPHGAYISIYNCRGTTVVGGRRGRWCQTVYSNYQGWVFSGFLTR